MMLVLKIASGIVLGSLALFILPFLVMASLYLFHWVFDTEGKEKRTGWRRLCRILRSYSRLMLISSGVLLVEKPDFISVIILLFVAALAFIFDRLSNYFPQMKNA